jgi:hypothetical protein
METLREIVTNYRYFSAVAFTVTSSDSLDESMKKSDADVSIGVQFSDTSTTLFIKIKETDFKNPFLIFLQSQEQKLATLNTKIELI